MLRDPNATVEAITRWIRSYFDGACPKGRAVVGISGGKRGVGLIVAPEPLAKFLDARFVDIVQEGR